MVAGEGAAARAPDGVRPKDLRHRVGGRCHRLYPHVRSEPIYGLKKTMIYSSSAVSINVHGNHMINGENFRVFEVAMTGKCVSFSAYKPDLVRCFEPETEVVIFRDPEDLDEKIRSRLGRNGVLGQIAEAAQLRASLRAYLRRSGGGDPGVHRMRGRPIRRRTILGLRPCEPAPTGASGPGSSPGAASASHAVMITARTHRSWRARTKGAALVLSILSALVVLEAVARLLVPLPWSDPEGYCEAHSRPYLSRGAFVADAELGHRPAPSFSGRMSALLRVRRPVLDQLPRVARP